MFEAFARDSAASGGLLVHHPHDLNKSDAYEPWTGDVIMANRPSGGHIDIIAWIPDL